MTPEELSNITRYAETFNISIHKYVPSQYDVMIVHTLDWTHSLCVHNYNTSNVLDAITKIVKALDK